MTGASPRLGLPGMPVRHRKIMLGALVGAFTLQATLVYSDPSGTESGPLSAEAVAGRAVWHARNCQTCHSIYGLGGHLGPDLTNLAATFSPDGLGAVLAAGPAQMPAYDLGHDEVTSLHAYFREIARTGVSEAHAAAPDLRDVPWFSFRK